jgi:hypothetical protein
MHRLMLANHRHENTSVKWYYKYKKKNTKQKGTKEQKSGYIAPQY